MNEIKNNKNREFPYEFKELEDALQKEICQKFPNQPEMVLVGPEKYFLPKGFKDLANKIYNFDVRPDDVFICTYPRSGTTWTQEMVWLICNDLDYETAKKTSLRKRSPYLEVHLVTNEHGLKELAMLSDVGSSENIIETSFEYLENQKGPRFIKTHLPIEFLPWRIKEVGAKVVYVARGPKDAAVSFYHFQKNPFFRYSGNFEEYSKYFLSDLVMYSPYWSHVNSGWKHKSQAGFHFLFFEEYKADMKKCLKKLAEFLGKPLRDDDLPKLIQHLDFDNARNNRAINFGDIMLRKGTVGKNSEMSGEIERKFNEWIKKKLKSSGVMFPFEILKEN